MIERYIVPAISSIFSPETKYEMWVRIEIAHVKAAQLMGSGIADAQLTEIIETPIPSAVEIAAYEENVTGHDVVAFLALWTAKMDPELVPYIHHGLTSSDIVDTAMFQQLWLTVDVLSTKMLTLIKAFENKDFVHNSYPRIGRTHGQYAEPTTMRHRVAVWMEEFNTAAHLLEDAAGAVDVMKAPGATGNSWFHSKEHVVKVADLLGISEVIIGTQVLSRSRVIVWSRAMLSLALLCENIAMEVRLSARSEVGEIYEAVDRVGSSSMPGKRNPIGAENICGLARIARGYVNTLSENTVLHNDRDISNSSVERIVIEDLAHTIAAMLERTTSLIANIKLDDAKMLKTLRENQHAALASTYQFLIQKHFKIGSIEASSKVKHWMESVSHPNQLELGFLLKALSWPDEPNIATLNALVAELETYSALMGIYPEHEQVPPATN